MLNKVILAVKLSETRWSFLTSGEPVPFRMGFCWIGFVTEDTVVSRIYRVLVNGTKRSTGEAL